MLPKITLITPVFNCADYIAECIESVLNQVYPSLEYIIVDGGSTDGTPEIIQRYLSRSDLPQKILRFVSEADKGMYDAVAKGFRLASGEVFGYLNADDLLEGNGLMRVGEFFRDHPLSSIVYHEDTVLMDGWKFPNVRQPEGIDTADLVNQHILFQDGVFFRRQAYEAIGGIRADLKLAGDFDLWLRLSSRFPMNRRSGHVSCFRIRPGQLSSDFKSYQQEASRATADFLKGMPAPERLIIQARAWWRKHVLSRFRRAPTLPRLFYPIDFPNLPPPPVSTTTPVHAPASSPVDGRPVEELLFSSFDTRFGDRAINHIYHDIRHNISVTHPPIDDKHLDELYQLHYSGQPSEKPPVAGTSPYRNFNRQPRFVRFLLKIPFEKCTTPDDWQNKTFQELSEVLDELPGKLPSSMDFLDAGCFEGALLDEIRAHTSWNRFGFDPNPGAVAAAQAKGHHVWQTHAEDILETTPPGTTFDIIYLGQSIEHVKNPVDVLRKLSLLLKPHGILVASTPNLDSCEIDWFGPTWAHWHPPYHRHIFSQDGLKHLATAAGLAWVDCRTFSHPYWTAMTLEQNSLGLGGSVSHSTVFKPKVTRKALRIQVLKQYYFNRRGQGDYFYAVMRPTRQ